MGNLQSVGKNLYLDVIPADLRGMILGLLIPRLRHFTSWLEVEDPGEPEEGRVQPLLTYLSMMMENPAAYLGEQFFGLNLDPNFTWTNSVLIELVDNWAEARTCLDKMQELALGGFADRYDQYEQIMIRSVFPHHHRSNVGNILNKLVRMRKIPMVEHLLQRFYPLKDIYSNCLFEPSGKMLDWLLQRPDFLNHLDLIAYCGFRPAEEAQPLIARILSDPKFTCSIPNLWTRLHYFTTVPFLAALIPELMNRAVFRADEITYPYWCYYSSLPLPLRTIDPSVLGSFFERGLPSDELLLFRALIGLMADYLQNRRPTTPSDEGDQNYLSILELILRKFLSVFLRPDLFYSFYAEFKRHPLFSQATFLPPMIEQAISAGHLRRTRQMI